MVFFFPFSAPVQKPTEICSSLVSWLWNEASSVFLRNNGFPHFSRWGNFPKWTMENLEKVWPHWQRPLEWASTFFQISKLFQMKSGNCGKSSASFTTALQFFLINGHTSLFSFWHTVRSFLCSMFLVWIVSYEIGSGAAFISFLNRKGNEHITSRVLLRPAVHLPQVWWRSYHTTLALSLSRYPVYACQLRDRTSVDLYPTDWEPPRSPSPPPHKCCDPQETGG